MKALLLWLGLMVTVMGGQEDRLADIRKWYGQIQSAKPASKQEILFEAANEPLAGEMTVRKYAGGLMAITLGYGAGDHGGADEHYYFRNGELFFIFVEESTWRFTGEEGADGNPKVHTTLRELRYYLDGGKCFRLLDRKIAGPSTDDLEKKLRKMAQKSLKPGDDAVEIIQRGQTLAKAKNARDILKSFAAELEPAE